MTIQSTLLNWLLENEFLYHKIGYERRVMTFGKNGTILLGRTALEDRWECDEKSLTIRDSEGQETCKLIFQKEPVFKGIWTRFAKMPVEISQIDFKNYIWNEKEIRIIGLKRSGHHGIITWIAHHFEEPVCFLNNIVPFHNPFVSKKASIIGDKETNRFYNIPTEASGGLSYKKCLMYNYEDQYLERICNEKVEELNSVFLGKSQEKYNVLVLRNPFNLIASRLRAANEAWISEMIPNPKTEEGRKMTSEIWKKYAKEFLGDTNYLKEKICINYDKWHHNEQYRASISSSMKLEFTDSGKNVINDIGSSSFEPNKRDAKELKVTERWKEYAADEYYRSFFDDEMIDLATRIFEDLPSLT